MSIPLSLLESWEWFIHTGRTPRRPAESTVGIPALGFVRGGDKALRARWISSGWDERIPARVWMAKASMYDFYGSKAAWCSPYVSQRDNDDSTQVGKAAAMLTDPPKALTFFDLAVAKGLRMHFSWGLLVCHVAAEFTVRAFRRIDAHRCMGAVLPYELMTLGRRQAPR